MNTIKLVGTLISDLFYSHETNGEKFFETYISINRLSDKSDVLKCIVPEVVTQLLKKGNRVAINGEIRTRNVVGEDGKSYLDIFVFVKEVGAAGDKDINDASVTGTICKKSEVRTTSDRTLIDFIVASNRRKHKSAYIPSIAWNRNAERINNMSIGTELVVKGRLQSRKYKKLIDGEIFYKVAYELSVFGIWEGANSEEV